MKCSICRGFFEVSFTDKGFFSLKFDDFEHFVSHHKKTDFKKVGFCSLIEAIKRGLLILFGGDFDYAVFTFFAKTL